MPVPMEPQKESPGCCQVLGGLPLEASKTDASGKTETMLLCMGAPRCSPNAAVG